MKSSLLFQEFEYGLESSDQVHARHANVTPESFQKICITPFNFIANVLQRIHIPALYLPWCRPCSMRTLAPQTAPACTSSNFRFTSKSRAFRTVLLSPVYISLLLKNLKRSNGNVRIQELCSPLHFYRNLCDQLVQFSLHHLEIVKKNHRQYEIYICKEKRN